jgi:hypothetical protein
MAHTTIRNDQDQDQDQGRRRREKVLPVVEERSGETWTRAIWFICGLLFVTAKQKGIDWTCAAALQIVICDGRPRHFDGSINATKVKAWWLNMADLYMICTDISGRWWWRCEKGSGYGWTSRPLQGFAMSLDR